jgi:hypothetical protein
MTKLKTMFGLCVLTAFAVCAFAAQGASANTAYECAPTTSGAGFSDAHCKTAVGGGAAFKHVEIPVNTSKAITLTNITTGTERSPWKLTSVQAGVALVTEALEVEGTGTLENKISGSEMWSEFGLTLTYRNVTVSAPAGKGCKVTGSGGVEGVVPTKPLSGTTKGLTSQVKLSPASGSAFAEFVVSGCSIAALNHAYTLTGSAVSSSVGTTFNYTCVNVTNQGTLFLFSQKAGFEGSGTLKTDSNGVAFT